MQQALLWAAAGTGFTFSMTALGAAMVFFMKKQSTALMQRIFLGFAAGVMIAASVWSLLIPAIEETEQAGGVGWLPASGGFVLGILLGNTGQKTGIGQRGTKRIFIHIYRSEERRVGKECRSRWSPYH